MNTLKFYISILFCSLSLLAQGQQSDEEYQKDKDFIESESSVDTIQKKSKYGLRFGADIVAPIFSYYDEDYKGYEFVADFRFSKRWFVAAEFGYADKFSEEDNLNFSTEGSYYKLGVNYNLYKSWGGINNEIYFGYRQGFSNFSQTLHNYTPAFNGTYFPGQTITTNEEFKNLNAHWGEIIAGLKVEVFTNLFMGFSFSFKRMWSQDEPENFKNLYIPGFNRVFLNNTGFGYNYTISYLIPIYKK